MALHNVRERLRLLHDVAGAVRRLARGRAVPRAHRRAAVTLSRWLPSERMTRAGRRRRAAGAAAPARAAARLRRSGQRGHRRSRRRRRRRWLCCATQPLRPAAAGHRHAGPRRHAAGRRAARRCAEPPAWSSSPRMPSMRCSAFDLDAVDYLTKPVSRERLQSALQRVAQRRRAADAPAAAADERRCWWCSDRGRVLRVPLADVLYLKAELKYVTLRTAGAQLRARRLARRAGAAPGRAASCACTATRWSRARPCARCERRRGDGASADEGHADTGPCSWRPRTNGWPCRAASWRRCARRCRSATPPRTR